MELNKYLIPLRKWWWLLAASTAIAALFSLVSILRQPTTYQARTTLMIGMTITDPNPSTNELTLGQQLAAAYADLANREIVVNATKNALQMHDLPGHFAHALPNTQIIDITVVDVDPQRAQIVANELAKQLILLSPAGASSKDQGRQKFIQEQLNILETQIKQTQADIADMQEELANTYSAQQINDQQSQISSLQSKLTAMQNNYGLLLSNTQEGAVNTLTVIEPADLPSRPMSSSKGMSFLLAIAVGFVLAACEAYLLEYLDDTLKSPDDVERLFGAPIIGHIFEQIEKNSEENRLYNANDLRHPIAEAFRSLRTNLEITQMEPPLKTILITSPDMGDGKTSVASNLALSLGQREKDVVLLDVDLRRPNVHQFFELDNDCGLVNFLSDGVALEDVLRSKQDGKLSVVTAGKPPLNPTEVLSSKRMDQLLGTLVESADVVILDGPPFIVADAMVMASKVDGVLMVIRPGHTRKSLALGALEQLKLSGAKVVGVVLNRIPLRGADYYSRYRYLYDYDSGHGGGAGGDREKKIDIETVKEAILSYASKVNDFLKHLFKDVFKLSPK